MNRKNYIKTGVFFIIFFILFYFGQKVVTASDYRNYQWVRGFYKEEENSLDAVYLGSSNCYSFWNPLVAWEEYGITVWPYSTNSQPFIAAEYLMKEVRKTQPDATFIINTSTIFVEDNTFKVMHYLLDYMPFSMNKLALTNYLCDSYNIPWEERREYYIPMIRYHSRWNSLEKKDFFYSLNGYKGAADYDTYRYSTNDISDNYIFGADCTGVQTPRLEEYLVEAVNSLLDYCTEENINVVFVTVPRAEGSAENLLKIQAVNDMISARGFDVLPLTDKTEEMGIDITRDFYNNTHTNVHGSIKFTHWLAEYLVEKFGFEDKRGQAEYASWDASFEKYMADEVSRRVVDFELNPAARDYTLGVVQNLSAKAENGAVVLTWDKVEGAEGYVVYKQDGKKQPLVLAADTADLSFTDTDVVPGQEITYGYTVAAYRTENGVQLYGDIGYEPFYLQF